MHAGVSCPHFKALFNWIQDKLTLSGVYTSLRRLFAKKPSQ
jgi:hypothetical protein